MNFLDVNRGVAESFFGLAPRGVITLDQRNIIVGDAHAAPAAAGNRFDHDRVTDPLGGRERLLFILDEPLGPGRHWHPGFFREGAAGGFVFERIHRARIRANETYITLLADVGEMGVLRKEAIAGVNRIHIGDFRRADDPGDAQVTVRCFGALPMQMASSASWTCMELASASE